VSRAAFAPAANGARAHNFGLVICGGGPAGLGLLICAAREGKLERLLDEGVAIVERRDTLGSGSMAHYRINANSLGVAFLESLDELREQERFARLLDAEATRELAAWRDRRPPLRVVGRYLAELGAVVGGTVARHPSCEVVTQTEVRKIRLLPGGGVVVSGSRANEDEYSVTGKRAVIAMGGKPPADFASCTLAPGLDLRPFASKVVHASKLLDSRSEVEPELRASLAGGAPVTIVGGRHSGWSTAWLLLNDDRFRAENPGDGRITILHRGTIDLFFPTAAEAEAAGYSVDLAKDVCPLSGRVHRYGGLRGDARALALQTLRGAGRAAQIRLVDLQTAAGVEAARSALEQAAVVISATGHQPRLPELVAADGAPLHVAYRRGGAATSERALFTSEDGSELPELVGYGLGAGLKVSPDVGGEQGYPVAEGVWLYHYDVGRVVLRTLFPDDSGVPLEEEHHPHLEPVE